MKNEKRIYTIIKIVTTVPPMWLPDGLVGYRLALFVIREPPLNSKQILVWLGFAQAWWWRWRRRSKLWLIIVVVYHSRESLEQTLSQNVIFECE
jgi:hypothetical protein